MIKKKCNNLWGGDKQRKVMVYYFSFPHYRLSVLQELQERLGDHVDFCSGNNSRGGLKILTEKDFPGLQVYSTKYLGPLTWDKGIVRKAIFGGYAQVILAPATTSMSTWALLILRRLSGRQTFLWGQCGKPGDRSVKRLLQELMNRMSSGLLVYGSLEEAGATELGLPARKVKRVLNAVPVNPVPFAPRELAMRLQKSVNDAVENGRLRLVFIGRINTDKNVEVLLRSGLLLKEKYPRLSICLIGEGTDKSRLEEEYTDPIFQFRGAIYDKTLLQEEVSSATFVVSPSLMGLLALDALSAGVPVLIPDHPRNGSEVESLVPGLNGFYFKHGDSGSLAEQVDSALTALKSVNPNQYYDSREDALRAWSPGGVAKNICKAIKAE